MLAYAYTIVWLFGLWAIGLQMAKRAFNFDVSRQVVLGYPLGLAIVGMVSLFLWQAGWSFTLLYGLSYLSGGVALLFSLSDIQNFLRSLRQKKGSLWALFEGLSLLELVFLFFISGTLALLITWLWSVQPVVWDSLVLYDWRAARIADGWPMVRFFTEFTHHSEFYNYDFSHPFLSSIWQAFIHKSGLETSGLIYIGLIISALAYARILLKNRLGGLLVTFLLTVTAPMIEVITQVYSALGFLWYWLLLLFLFIDDELGGRARNVLMLLFLLTTMLNRQETPFWLVFLIWWIGYEWQTGKKLVFTSKVKKSMTMAMPALSIFANWLWLQKEAATHIVLPVIQTRSSYDLGHYSQLAQLLEYPEWLWQAAWLITALNPSFAYVLLAFILGLLGRKPGHQEKWLWGLVIGWLAMLFVALIFEISTSPDLWQAKARLLSRVSLPLIAVSMTLIVQQLRKRS